jgi:hypothetical protein
VVTISAARLSAPELAARLRADDACVFARIEGDRVRLDMRTVSDEELVEVAAALRRISAGIPPAT